MAKKFEKNRLVKWEEPEGLMGGTIYEVGDTTLKVHSFDGRTLTLSQTSVTQIPHQRGPRPSHAACQKLKDEVAKSREMRSRADVKIESEEIQSLESKVTRLEAKIAEQERLVAKQERIIATYKEVILNKAIDSSDLSDSVAKLIELVEVVLR